MTAQVTHCPHPVLSQEGRVVREIEILPRETIGSVLSRCHIDVDAGQFVVSVNGNVTEDMGLIVSHGDMVAIRAIVEGGGDSDPLRVILSLAVVVAAPYLGGYVGGYWASQAATAGVAALTVVGGYALVNSIIPPGHKATALSSQQDETSPTYNLSGARNRIRLNQPMPLIYGTHKFVPDLAMKPYTEIRNGDLYLFVVYGMGLSLEATFTDFKIGDTPLSSYKDVEVEWSDYNGRLSKFAGNVDTLDVGSELNAAAGWVTRTTSDDTRILAIDIVGTLYHVADNGDLDYHNVKFDGEYRKVGAAEWTSFFYDTEELFHDYYWSAGYTPEGKPGLPGGAFWVQVAYGDTDPNEHTEGEEWGTITDEGYDYFAPASATHTVTWTYRHFDAAGDDPTPTRRYYASIDSIIISNNTTKAVRVSRQRYVEAGQYEVRLRRNSPEDDNDRYQSSFTWSVLRSYQRDESDYTGQRRLGLIIRASEQISGVVDTLSCIASAKIPVFVDEVWNRLYTSNPAWAFLNVALGKSHTDGRRLYGGGLHPSRIDYDSIIDFAAWCDEKGWTFDYVFDKTEPVESMLTTIAMAGRGAYTWASGKLGVIWDEERLPAVAMYGMPNIVAGSFTVKYLSAPGVDAIECNYLDAANDYQAQTIRADVPNAQGTGNVARKDLAGVTSKAVANRHANLIAAEQYYRRRRISWETDLEGMVCTRGDVIRLSHDLTQWGYSGRLLAGSTINGVSIITLDRDVPFTEGQDHWVMLRQPNGTYDHYQVYNYSGSVNRSLIRLQTNPPLLPDQDVYNSSYDYVWFYEPSTTPGKNAKIIDLSPVNERQIRIVATDEVNQFYDSEYNPTWEPPQNEYYGPVPAVNGIDVTEVLLSKAGQSECNLYFDIENAIGVRLRIKRNDESWRDYGEIRGTDWSGRYQQGDVLQIEAKPWAVAVTLASATFIKTYNVLGKLAPPSDVTGFYAEIWNQNIRLRWNPIPDVDVEFYEVRYGASWEDGVTIAQGLTTEAVYRQLTAGTHNFWVKAHDAKRASDNATHAILVIEGPRAASITYRVIDNNVLLFMSASQGSFPVVGYEIFRGDDYQSPDETLKVNGTFATFFLRESGTYTFWVRGIDTYDNPGVISPISITVNEPPDYVLVKAWQTDWTGTHTNTIESDGYLIGCVDTTETFEEHFDDNSWTNPDDQITAGYPYYLEPTLDTGAYSEEFDYGSVIAAATISLDGLETQITGSTNVVATISYKENSGDSWTDMSAGVKSGFAQTFQYVKVALAFTGSGNDDIVRVHKINVLLDIKKKRDSGMATCNSGDSGGTTINFNKTFSDVTKAPIGTVVDSTSPRYVVVDFTDTPNPTSFKALVFDETGTRQTNLISWDVEGY
jgi:hypothetical protein